MPVSYGMSGCPRIVVQMVDQSDSSSTLLENGLMLIDTFTSYRPYRFPVTGDSDYIFEIPDREGNVVTWVAGSTVRVPMNTSGYDTVMSVGYGSEFLNNVVSFLLVPPRESGRGLSGLLVTGPANLESRYCMDGVMAYVGIDPLFPRVYATLSWSEGYRNFDEALEETRSVPRGQPDGYYLQTTEEFLVVPYSLVNELVHILGDRGFRFQAGPFGVNIWSLPSDQCTGGDFGNLPALRITIYNESTPSVNIFIEPNEYIRVDPYQSACFIRLRGARHTLALGAPLFRTAAVLFDQNRVGFCEPR